MTDKQPLPLTNRAVRSGLCQKCGEWFHNAHACPVGVIVKKAEQSASVLPPGCCIDPDATVYTDDETLIDSGAAPPLPDKTLLEAAKAAVNTIADRLDAYRDAYRDETARFTYNPWRRYKDPDLIRREIDASLDELSAAISAAEEEQSAAAEPVRGERWYEQSAAAEPVRGERWYILRSGAKICSEVTIELVTPAVIGIKTNSYWGDVEVVPRGYLTLVECVAAAPTANEAPCGCGRSSCRGVRRSSTKGESK